MLNLQTHKATLHEKWNKWSNWIKKTHKQKSEKLLELKDRKNVQTIIKIPTKHKKGTKTSMCIYRRREQRTEQVHITKYSITNIEETWNINVK